MRQFIDIVTENHNEFISLDEIYLDDDSPLDRDNEIINNFVSPMDYDIKMPVRTMNANEASTRILVDGRPLIEVYKDHATDDQKETVQYKIDRFDKNRIVVLNGDMVLDGNHHIIAAILSNRPLKYVDIQDMEDQ